jgi:hypothetical protein
MAQVFVVGLLPRRCGFNSNLIIVWFFGVKCGFVTGFSCQNMFSPFSIIPQMLQTHLLSYKRRCMILELQSVPRELTFGTGVLHLIQKITNLMH